MIILYMEGTRPSVQSDDYLEYVSTKTWKNVIVLNSSWTFNLIISEMNILKNILFYILIKQHSNRVSKETKIYKSKCNFNDVCTIYAHTS